MNLSMERLVAKTIGENLSLFLQIDFSGNQPLEPAARYEYS